MPFHYPYNPQRGKKQESQLFCTKKLMCNDPRFQGGLQVKMSLRIVVRCWRYFRPRLEAALGRMFQYAFASSSVIS